MLPKPETTMTTEETLVNRLILHANDIQAPGLLHGQMGAVLVIATYAGQLSKPYLDNAADFLYNIVVSQITNRTDIDFASGLAGISWGVEYLTQNGILPGVGNDICSDMDKQIMTLDIRRINDFSLESGLLGLWTCVWARIQGNLMAGLPLPFDSVYLKDWSNVLEQHADRFPRGAYRRLQNAINGNLDYEPLDFRLFVTPMNQVPETNMSLSNGIAGYIALNYLKQNEEII